MGRVATSPRESVRSRAMSGAMMLAILAMAAPAAPASPGVGAEPQPTEEPGADESPLPPEARRESLLDRVNRLVSELDADTWQKRHEAFESLLDLAWLDLRAVEPLLESSNLSPEARVRLERVAFEMFRQSPRAGMGIGFGGPTGGGVSIGRTVPGFDASRVLRPNDIILEADGHQINETLDLQAAIVSTEPGHVMRLLVRRPGEGLLRLECEMGSYEELGNPGPVDERVLHAAWRLRRARRDADRDQPSPIELPAPQPHRSSSPSSEETVAAADARVSPGGVGRGGADQHERLRVRIMERDLEVRSTEGTRDAIRAGDQGDLLRALIDQIGVEQSALRTRIMANQQLLKDAQLGEARRAEIQAENARLARELKRLNDELQAFVMMYRTVSVGRR